MVNIKELHPESGPQAAFGARLRSSREARGWTQDDLGDRMGYSSKHISAIETARRVATLRFVRAIDVAFGLDATAETFEREWREIRHGILLEGFPEYVGYERRASEIRLYDIGVVPGLLQTREYAEVLANRAAQLDAITSEHAAERVAFLAERQAALVRPRPPMMHVVMDESCIRRRVGGPEIMDAQLERLVEFAAQPNTVLQIAPFEMGERRSIRLPVYLLTLSDRSVVFYAESQAQGHLDREPTSVLPVLMTYHQLQAEALSQAETVALIQQARKGMS